MAFVLSSVSGNLISAASAGYAPTNSGDVSAIASAYQVVTATATQFYAGTAYLTSVNGAPVSASRAGQAANASLANSAYYDGTGRLISALPDSAAVSSIASAYTTGKQDTLTFSYNTANQISSINGSALGGMDEAAVSGIASAYAESAASGCIPTSMSSDFQQVTGMSSYALSSDVSATVDLVGTQSANWGGSALALSAGPGVSLTLSGSTLIAGLDETVLWTGAVSMEPCGTFTLSEYLSNFDRIRFYGSSYANTPVLYECPAPIASSDPISVTYVYYCAGSDASPSQCRQTNYTSTNGLTFNASSHRFVCGNDARYNTGNTMYGAPIYKIVGINRTAGV